VAAQRPGPPYLVTAARDLGVFDNVCWVLALGAGDTLSRNVFHLFEPRAPTPAWVLKFARVAAYGDPFDRDERGLELAARAGSLVARRAPRLVGRMEVDGVHLSLETAAVGSRLRELLLAPAPRSEKLQLVERVAAWILDVARETATGADALQGERRRLRDDVLPAYASAGVRADLVSSLPPIRPVLQHNDLGSWNIVCSGADFTVLDWESSSRHGLPLWDLFYFLADALALVDGSPLGEMRHLHTIPLFRGELPSSEVLFEWTRRGVEATAVPPDAVGSIATLCWLHHSLSHVRRGAVLDEITPGADSAVHGTEKVGRAWIADAALGENWASWRAGLRRRAA
jgi:hypothetical protein